MTNKTKIKKESTKIKNESKKIKKENNDKIIEKYYEKIKEPGSFGGIKKIYNELRKKHKNIKEDDIKNFLGQKDEYTLHKPIIRKFNRNKVIVSGIDDIWQMDLVDMKAYKNENNNVTFILTIIDVFSKYAWGRMLPDKKAETVLKAIISVIKTSKRKPKKIHTDEGTEFFNKNIKNYLVKENIKLYNTHSFLKASIVERFNRTLKEKMWRYFTSIKSKKYYDKFDEFFVSYNSSYHKSIKMSPDKVKKSNSAQVFKNLYNFDRDEGEYITDVKVLFKIGDFVRISKYKKIFDKGYEANWTNEVFEVVRIIFNNTYPVYYIKDLLEVEINGGFYAEELQKVTINIKGSINNNDYIVESVIKTRTIKGKKEYFVRWKYYPDSTNSWIKEENWIKK